MAVSKKVFQVVVHDDVDIHLNEMVLASSPTTARDRAVRLLGEDVNLDEVNIVVTPLGQSQF